MTNLCKILETVYGTYPENYGGSPTKEQHNQTHQQILALIPKKKYPIESDMGPSQIEIEVCDIWNECIDEITHNLTKEE